MEVPGKLSIWLTSALLLSLNIFDAWQGAFSAISGAG